MKGKLGKVSLLNRKFKKSKNQSFHAKNEKKKEKAHTSQLNVLLYLILKYSSLVLIVSLSMKIKLENVFMF